VFGSLGLRGLLRGSGRHRGLALAADPLPRFSAVSRVLQTVPSLALLAFLIAIVGGIGLVPALIALFLYALLPIVRNTLVGLRTVPGELGRAALSLGLTPTQSLAHVQLPLALPTILAGIKTAAVINVGTATMAAFIRRRRFR
jgi:osmoprotectant transport system permease protein